MSDYNFEHLSAIDFEQLANDLLSAELKVPFESFKEGKDQGIDLRHIKNGNQTIVQCKRYKKNGVSSLSTSLKKEKIKMDKIKPSKYILFTSTALSAKNKEAIIKNLSPHCLSASDIYGHSEINALLRKYPHVETAHHKLWMPSTNILKKIIAANIDNLSILTLDQIKQKILQYHRPPYFTEAEDILKSCGHLLIAGPAGSGKTALTQALAIQYIAEGYEIICISDDIKSTLHKLSATEKQLFIYDDFLGQTSFEEKLEKNEDNLIVKLIKRCLACKNTKFILSTREYILKTAYNTYEKLDQSKKTTKTITLNPLKLSMQDKAKITHSMLHYSTIDHSRKLELVLANCHKELINSKNFNPRIIDMSINHDYWKDISAEKHVKTILNNISSPTELWEHIYNNQLSDQQKSTVEVIGSFEDNISLDNFEHACTTYHSLLQVNHAAKPGIYAFNKTMKTLVGDFLSTSKSSKDEIFVSTINPSLKDFIIDQISKNKSNKNLFFSAVYFEQIKNLTTKNFNTLNKFGLSLGEKLIEQAESLTGSSHIHTKDRITPRQIITLLSWIQQLKITISPVTEKKIESKISTAKRMNLGEIQQIYSKTKSINTSEQFNAVILATAQKHFAKEFEPEIMDENHLDDWEIVSDISIRYPEIIDKDTLFDLPDMFEEFCETHSAAFCDETLDEDELTSLRDSIETIAHKLGCMGSLTFDIEARLEELLDEIEEAKAEEEEKERLKPNPDTNKTTHKTKSPQQSKKPNDKEVIDNIFFDFTEELQTHSA